MNRVYICHYSEIGLKGKNRSYFVKILRRNMKMALRRVLPGKPFEMEHRDKRFIITFNEAVEQDRVASALSQVFGLANISPVTVTEPTLDAMEAAAVELYKGHSFETFAIRTKRAYKGFPFTSPDVNQRLGGAVADAYHKRADLKNPELPCYVEVLKDKAFVTVGKTRGAGGLPVGSSGRVMVLMSGGFDSPVAAYFAMKRGAQCEFIHFHSYPFTQKTSQEKVEQLVKVLTKYQFRARLYMVPFAETQKEIVLTVPEKFRVIFYRRFMMRVAEALAVKQDLKAIYTGESLGQVASQTLENMAAVQQAITMPVLRPLIGLDKNEIIDLARNIGTHDISALPHDDACTRFMPEFPVIRAKMDQVLEAEQALNVEELVARDLAHIEIIDL